MVSITPREYTGLLSAPMNARVKAQGFSRQPTYQCLVAPTPSDYRLGIGERWGRGSKCPNPLPTPDVYRGGKGKRKQKGLYAFQGGEEHRYTG